MTFLKPERDQLVLRDLFGDEVKVKRKTRIPSVAVELRSPLLGTEP